MRIKKQLQLFLAGAVLIPFNAVLIIPVVDYIADESGISNASQFIIIGIITFIFELLIILFTLHLSKTIQKSIKFLQNSTKKLADGEVNDSLERRKSNRGANEITDLIVNLEKMRLTLRENEERRNKLIMGISHDLRTPVAVIKGYSEAIADGVITDPEEIQKTVQIMLSKSEQLENMINTLINYVKLNSQTWKKNLVNQPIEPMLSSFINSSVGTGTIFKRNVKGSINISKDISLPYDSELVQRALENLYSNALRYTNEGDEINLTAEETDSEIIVKIEDSGIGMDKKDQQYIFDMFYRASTSRREAGYGIGLSVVKNIIDIHGWKIDVESQKGVGTTFIIKIPKTN